jgi:hypothetical protein
MTEVTNKDMIVKLMLQHSAALIQSNNDLAVTIKNKMADAFFAFGPQSRDQHVAIGQLNLAVKCGEYNHVKWVD